MSNPAAKPDSSPPNPISTSMPTSAFFLARLEGLRTSLLNHFQYILETAQPGARVVELVRDPANDRVVDETFAIDENKIPSLAQTKMEQVRMDIEVEALIKDCEDLLGLSRLLKECWLFGGLNTIKKPDGKEEQNEAEAWVKAREGMETWLKQYFEKESESARHAGTEVGGEG